MLQWSSVDLDVLLVLLEEAVPLPVQPHPLNPPHGLPLALGRLLRKSAVLGNQLLPVDQSDNRALHKHSLLIGGVTGVMCKVTDPSPVFTV